MLNSKFILMSMFVVAGASLTGSVQQAQACGFLVSAGVGGQSFETVHKAKNPMSILLYKPSNAQGSNALFSAANVKMLEKIGHTVKVFENVAEAKAAWASGNHSAVIADLGDMGLFKGSLAANDKRVMIPVAVAGTQVPAGEYKLVLNVDPAQKQRMVSIISVLSKAGSI